MAAARPYFLPHPPYAEDQPYAKSILTAHVAYRAFQMGAVLGTTAGAGRALLQKSWEPSLSTRTKLLRASGAWSLWTIGFVGVGLVLRMRGRETIEWQDRSWRLLENGGQRSVDRWSGAGTVAGAVLGLSAAGAVASGRTKALVVLGSAGWGSLVGCVGSMGWRAVNGEEK